MGEINGRQISKYGGQVSPEVGASFPGYDSPGTTDQRSFHSVY